MRLGVLATHPIQYQAPLFRRIAERVDLTVYFAHQQSARDHARADFGVEFEWDIPLLEGYRHRFLHNRARNPDVSTFRGCDTPEISGVLLKERYDAFLLLGWYNRSFLQAIYGGWRAGTPLMVRGDSQLLTRRRPILRLAKRAAYRLLMGMFDAHLYVGTRSREYYEHYGARSESLFFAPHFVDTDFFRRLSQAARPSRESVRNALGIASSDTALLFVGKLIGRKRPLQLIEMAARLNARGQEVVVVYVGSGPMEDEIRRYAAQSNVRAVMAGFKNQTELPAMYVAGDMLVLPSDARETWGLVVNEAMACGTPAAVSEAAGCSQDLIEEGSGVRFPLDDVAAASDEIFRYFSSIGAAQRRQSLDRLTKRYSVEAAADGILHAANEVRKA
jgi:glycosyltransferase involved in cell wall biosynthesis